jgi:hypothetical protein
MHIFNIDFDTGRSSHYIHADFNTRDHEHVFRHSMICNMPTLGFIQESSNYAKSFIRVLPGLCFSVGTAGLIRDPGSDHLHESELCYAGNVLQQTGLTKNIIESTTGKVSCVGS